MATKISEKERREKALKFVERSRRRFRALLQLQMPMTPKQLGIKLGMDGDTVGLILGQLAKAGLVRCLTPDVPSGRLYALTRPGMRMQRELARKLDLPLQAPETPEMDWTLYAWVSFRHRSAILKAMREPMRTSMIKRRAKMMNPHLRMRTGNAREVLKLFLKKGIAEKVYERKKKLPRFALTDRGRALQGAMLRSEALPRISRASVSRYASLAAS
jgi:DNA-binding MarR family transcriptional regulator